MKYDIGDLIMFLYREEDYTFVAEGVVCAIDNETYTATYDNSFYYAIREEDTELEAIEEFYAKQDYLNKLLSK